MGGRGSTSSSSDRQLQNSYKSRLEKQGKTNIVTSIRDTEKYTQGVMYRQGFRDTSFRLRKEGNEMTLIKYALGSEKPEVLAKGTTAINKYMRERGLVFHVGGY